MPPPPRRGRKPSPLSPESQEILRLSLEGRRPVEIAGIVNLPRTAVNAAINSLRRSGALERGRQHPTSLPADLESGPAKHLVPARLSDADVAAIDASGETPAGYVRRAVTARRKAAEMLKAPVAASETTEIEAAIWDLVRDKPKD